MECRVCVGSGLDICPGCEGAKRVHQACTACEGRGKVKCRARRCEKGRKKCLRCRGTRVEGKKSCSRCDGLGTTRCESCTRGKRICGDCKGQRRELGRCSKCRGSGETACTPCTGAGHLLIPPIPRKWGERLSAVQRQVDKAMQQLPRVHMELADLRRRIAAATPGSTSDDLDVKLETEPRQLPQNLQRLWARVDKARAALRKRVASNDTLLATITLAVGDSDTVREELEWIETEIETLELEHVFHTDRGLAEKVGELEGSVTGIQTALNTSGRKSKEALESATALFADVERVRSAREAFLEPYDDWRAEQQSTEAVGAATHLAFARFQITLPKLAEKSRLPPLVASLQDRQDPGMCVNLAFVDSPAGVFNKDDDVSHTEEYLRSLPGLVSATFQGTPEIERIDFAILSRVLGDTGHEQEVATQRFGFERDRWRELTTGVYRDDWIQLLAKSDPEPPFPKRTWTIAFSSPWFLFGAAMALLIVGVIFARMLRAAVQR